MGQEELLARNKDTLTRLNKENIKHKQMRDIANTKVRLIYCAIHNIPAA